MATLLDLGSPDMFQNPHPKYRQLFETYGNIYYSEKDDIFYIAGYRQIQEVLKHSQISSNRVDAMASRLGAEQIKALEPMLSNLKRWVIFLDPPQHTPIRRTILRALQPRSVFDLKNRIQAIVDDLITSVYDQANSFDFVQALAFPLPVIVISELLGADPKDREIIKEWSDDIAGFFNGKVKPDAVRKTYAAIVGLEEYFEDVWRKPRAPLSTNLLEALAMLREKGVSDKDIIANSIALIFAGHETTSNLIANGMKCLMDHPQTLDLVVHDAKLIPSFLAEVLRFDAPVQRVTRVTTEPVVIEGVKIPAGERVFCLLGAGNRDASIFQDPDRFDIFRNEEPSLSFGVGIHLCPGNHLALLESQIFFETFFSHFQDLECETPNPSYRDSLGLRALNEFRIRAKRKPLS
ncbi:cytochrome P450 [Pseudobacteriovorax antillogorgiicola]|uniref:Cytochrome P450 n=1 Tax=Pseudobacteriovorax antillogorgiicola TaxID=1513793 RepID=A0A1Y6C3G9_9BACT|nr:cytochrome P450 [Pseudobacteriovorax antillogorgiicola]TCS49850.1 hypothetical protein EDD56_11495 [Pseudobacteriovorax antillogorgiicola]SMF43705.1 hypothetical protein SAMN06296036_11394 [Pseudobacteriovorax antillogorgiicola]